VNQIEGLKPAIGCADAILLASGGRPMLRNAPAAVAAERIKNSRRVVADSVDLTMTGSLIRDFGSSVHDLGGSSHGTDDARVGGASAEITVHAIDDLLLAGVRVLRK
jgi:hypothetical protein